MKHKPRHIDISNDPDFGYVTNDTYDASTHINIPPVFGIGGLAYRLLNNGTRSQPKTKK